MILPNPSDCEAFLAVWCDKVGLGDADQGHASAQLLEIMSSTLDSSFPGALLAWPREKKQTVYYGVSKTAPEWRRLRPLLLSFVGPTLTGFSGAALNPDELKYGPETVLAASSYYAVARLVPKDTAEGRAAVEKALLRLRFLSKLAPPAARMRRTGTSTLIGAFYSAVADGNRVATADILERLRTEDRLDALNIAFLSIAEASGFRDWQSIVDHPLLDDIVVMPRPNAVTQAILDAIYATRIDVESATENPKHALQALLPSLRELLSQPRPPLLRDGARALAELFDSAEEPEERHQITPGWSAVDSAILTLLAAMRTDSLPALAAAIDVVNSLPSADRDALLTQHPINAMWKTANGRLNGLPVPSNWLEWLSLIEHEDFSNALTVAQAALGSWPVSDVLDPHEITPLADAILSVPEGIPGERLADAIPIIITWLKQDDSFPRPSLLTLYESLWTRLILGIRRGRSERDSTALLFDAILSIGVEERRYEEILHDALDVAGQPGRASAYWMLSLVETTVEQQAPTGDARANFWATVFTRLDQFRPHLTGLQALAVSALASFLKIPMTEELSAARKPDQAFEAMSDKMIAIYTLTERAAKQAIDTLSSSAPTARFSLYTDHVGSTPLRHAAETADIFIVVTASAKHAATDFISLHRPRHKPTLYAPGRGMSGIIRVLDEHLADSAPAGR